MKSFSHNFWLPVALLLTAAVSVPAQQTIIFSKPSDLSADKANSFMAGPQKTGGAGDFGAPKSIFNNVSPGDFAAPPPPVVNPLNPSVIEALDKRKNWTLLTPEQILGIQTPEEIMGVKTKKDQQKLTLEEKFLLRQSDQQNLEATNGRPGAAFWRAESDNGPFGSQNKNDAFSDARRGQPGGGKEDYFKQFLNDGAEPAGGADHPPASAWTSAFAQPSQPKQTPEQIAVMERFRALMEPSSPPEQPSVQTRFGAGAGHAVDPNLEILPVINPAGHSILPLLNNSTRPMGIKPLPTVATPAPVAPPVRPSWEAQLPPWLRSGPPQHSINPGY
jgi:hypothetical protein